jgi:hypothetical protein
VDIKIRKYQSLLREVSPNEYGPTGVSCTHAVGSRAHAVCLLFSVDLAGHRHDSESAEQSGTSATGRLTVAGMLTAPAQD